MNAISDMGTRHEGQLLAVALGTEAEIPALARFQEHADKFIAAAEEEIGREREGLAVREPRLCRRLARDSATPSVTDFARAPVVLLDNGREQQVRNSWREQLRANLDALVMLLADDTTEARRQAWLWWEDRQGDRFPFFRSVQVRACLFEARKLVALLLAEADVSHVLRGELIVSDDFAEDRGQWQSYGEGTAMIGAGLLDTRGTPLVVWTAAEPFPDGSIATIDFIPASGTGGLIFAFPAQPVAELDFSVSAATQMHVHVPPGNTDEMEPYNHGIETYHVSVHRGNGRTHLRRTGRGLKMLNVLAPDPCEDAGRTYRLAMLKRGESLQVFVDGKLIHAYVDAGVYGPVLGGGQFGLKLFGGGGEGPVEFSFANFSVHQLAYRC